MGAILGVGQDWETPRHQIQITQPLWCMTTPVTQKLWTEIMGRNPSVFDGDEYPVDSVSWLASLDFCNRLSIRMGLEPVYTIDQVFLYIPELTNRCLDKNDKAHLFLLNK